ncbi:hypothetical protein BGW41_007554 [Actinomortierella wolfii]|nr:hypothetical protein BGW41_007554 [Actinomortierella wolfii]
MAGNQATPSQDSPEPIIPPQELLDECLTEIGLGKFQIQLLVLCGLGWFADNMWLQGVALILPRVQDTFLVGNQYIGLMSSSIFVGMMLGAMFWGMLSDVRGRRQAFNLTLAVTSIFGFASSLSLSFPMLCVMLLLLGFGVGGSIVVDGALFLEFTPRKHQYLLTLLSIFFSFGALFASIVAVFILPPFSCNGPTSEPCQGRGWRYLIGCMAGATLLMVLGRVVFFTLPESPKYLINQNRHEEAAMVLNRIFRINQCDPRRGSFVENIDILTSQAKSDQRSALTSPSTESLDSDVSDGTDPSALQDYQRGGYRQAATTDVDEFDIEARGGIPGPTDAIIDASDDEGLSPRMATTTARSSANHVGTMPFTRLQRFRRWCGLKFHIVHKRMRPLFTPQYRTTTLLIWAIWILIAFGFTSFNVFLPKFMQEHGADDGHRSLVDVYIDTAIYASAGVPGSVIAVLLIEGRLGRRYTMAVATLGTAIAMCMFATLTSRAALVTFSAIVSLLATLNYAVLYSYTPEVFPSEFRGTACGAASALSRLASILAPLIAGALLMISTSIPLFVAAAAFLVSMVCMCLLPFETRGTAAM